MTNSGANWCIKALHPSDASVYSTGIPDGNPLPTVVQNFQMTATISAPVGEGQLDTWEYNSTLLPHPVNFMYWESNSGVVSDSGTILNTQLDGTSHSEKYENLVSMAQRWRLSHASVTLYQDGPSLADQGEIVVCQPICLPRTVNCSVGVINAGDVKDVVNSERINMYSAEDLPVYETCITSPNAYAARSRDGAYVPLKLTETCQDWCSEENDVGTTIYKESNYAHAGLSSAWSSLPGHTNEIMTANVFPHWTGNSNADELAPMSIDAPVGGPVDLFGQRTSKMMSDGVAHICVRNIARATSLQLVFRFGVEMQVHPSSVLGPQAKMPPGPDEAALKSYYTIIRELKDAYPASYNTIGKLWDIISATARNIVIPMLGPVAGTALKGVVKVGDVIRTRRQKKRELPIASQDKNKSTAASNTQAMVEAYTGPQGMVYPYTGPQGMVYPPDIASQYPRTTPRQFVPKIVSVRRIRAEKNR